MWPTVLYVSSHIFIRRDRQAPVAKAATDRAAPVRAAVVKAAALALPEEAFLVRSCSLHRCMCSSTHTHLYMYNMQIDVGVCIKASCLSSRCLLPEIDPEIDLIDLRDRSCHLRSILRSISEIDLEVAGSIFQIDPRRY